MISLTQEPIDVNQRANVRHHVQNLRGIYERRRLRLSCEMSARKEDQVLHIATYRIIQTGLILLERTSIRQGWPHNGSFLRVTTDTDRDSAGTLLQVGQ